MRDPVVIDALVRFLVFVAVLLIFASSQLFWVRRIGEGGRALIRNERARRVLAAAGTVFYFFLFIYNLSMTRAVPSPVRLTLEAALFEAPFQWWVLSSVLGFLVIVLLWCLDRLVRGGAWVFARLRPAAPLAPIAAVDPPDPKPASLSRRQFLERTAIAAGAVPFAACAYGLAFERLDLELTNKRIHLARLPKAFDGFRIVQLSDIHIGPFMSARHIRHWVDVANQTHADLVALTGDFVTWDSTTQEAVVDALTGLRAPYGVVGCLGNHELWTDCQNSITQLFRQRGIRILRQERAPLVLKGETLNLIGVDYQTLTHMEPRASGFVRHYLHGVDPLVMRDTANILLSHNPNTFDRAAELGIDLSLAGHTHGGQVTLEFVSPRISPASLVTAYVRGWFEKRGAQLYVNRGIGTIGVPIRLGAPPEITVFELVRQA